ncbi:hypothetical protein CC1G_01043 [Coprinopsis cinerea okayama7|uniref:Uncharacterized protein n=1 Tax=Coprinopsis cinerea (strain Okayama-7 / 130 / ATCC MYA-4618 / FGSC 9003) TaxID=240176 RepID=A8NEB8_COPC7|nr:hypothetical protein CC1G_01043 [Coprinopsis cinerea okayama7\|eukprot:XP_001832981.2 hypothetical protein CC1G_01043 [Coprinopsis cinerea okayama7\
MALITGHFTLVNDRHHRIPQYRYIREPHEKSTAKTSPPIIIDTISTTYPSEGVSIAELVCTDIFDLTRFIAGGNDLVMRRSGPNPINFRICWPGYHPSPPFVVEVASGNGQWEITRAELAKDIAINIVKFLGMLRQDAMIQGADPRYSLYGLPSDAEERLRIVCLRNISGRDWQADIDFCPF